MYILPTINENEAVSSKIAEIIFGNDSRRIKIRRLKAIRDSCETPLAKVHAEYFIKKLRKKINENIARMILAMFSLSYLIFTLCRMWWYYHPESNPLPDTNYTVINLIRVLYLLPIIGAVLWGVKKAVTHIKSK